MTPLPAEFLRLPIAHRALHNRRAGRPENSPGAIRAAVLAGYAIEIDLQLSKDGQAMVFHDEILDRLTDQTGPLRDRDAVELGRIHLRDCADAIPTLAQVLALIAGQVPLLIEIKDQTDAMSMTDGKLEVATVAALAAYTGPVAVMSFNPHSIAHIARLAPHIPRGLTTAAFLPSDWAPVPADRCDELREIPDFDLTGCSFISHEAADLARPRVAELKARNAAILCWTIRSPSDEAAARQVAHNVTFENYPAVIPVR